MPDTTDTGDEIVENSPNNELEKIAEENTASTEPSILTPIQETENMETHAHHLHHAPGKKFWHYFYEFLMLFLAVFCGFIAENWRESIVEHERERQYMQSLLSDLSTDTASIARAIPLKQGRIEAIDTVFRFFNSNPDAKAISGKLFKTIRRTTYDFRFVWNGITINELKSSGGMRLIRKKQVADSVSAYDVRYESTISLYNELYLSNTQVANRLCEKLFDVRDLLPLYMANTSPGIVVNIPDSISIRINTSELNQQLNFMMLEKSYARQEIDRYNDLRARATRLMGLVKKGYSLE